MKTKIKKKKSGAFTPPTYHVYSMQAKSNMTKPTCTHARQMAHQNLQAPTLEHVHRLHSYATEKVTTMQNKF